MNRYKPIIIVGILVAFVTVGLAMYEQLTAVPRDKKSDCNTRYIELTHSIEWMMRAKHEQMQSLSGRAVFGLFS
jgi:hypothetical protein